MHRASRESRPNRILASNLLQPRFVTLLAGIAVVACACSRPEPADPTGKGRTVIQYWYTWTNYEGEALRRVVDAFNDSNDKIYVDAVTVSDIENKLLVAITGRKPPDVASILWRSSHKYAAKRALIPLDDKMAAVGLQADRYLPSIWDVCHMDGRVWSLPLTPATTALHWNKDLFEEAGLDPDQPPRSIEELDRMAERLTKRGPNGEIVQMGFMQMEPDWWHWSWGFYFGGSLWNGKDRFTFDDPANIQAYSWFASYPEKYGRKEVETFRGGFGNFDSPENPFISGKVAMEIQGVWMANFIQLHNPDLRYGVAPFPGLDPDTPPPAYIEGDVIIIPKWSRHPEEAFTFIEWTQRQDMLELLNGGHKKFSPLKEASPGFYETHPNPHIKVFVELAKSPRWFSTPKTVLADLFNDETRAAADSIWMGEQTAEEAMRDLQERMQPQLDRVLAAKQKP